MDNKMERVEDYDSDSNLKRANTIKNASKGTDTKIVSVIQKA